MKSENIVSEPEREIPILRYVIALSGLITLIGALVLITVIFETNKSRTISQVANDFHLRATSLCNEALQNLITIENTLLQITRNSPADLRETHTYQQLLHENIENILSLETQYNDSSVGFLVERISEHWSRQKQKTGSDGTSSGFTNSMAFADRGSLRLTLRQLARIHENSYLDLNKRIAEGQASGQKKIVILLTTALFIGAIPGGWILHLIRQALLVRRRVERELRDYRDKLQQEVDARTAELKQALELANESIRSKMQFLANMSHEIRTPMNGVLGMLQALRDTSLSEEQAHLARIAFVSAESLLNILNDILSLSKIESGKLVLEDIEFDFIETVEDVADLLSAAAHKKEIEFIVNIDANVPHMIVSDPTRVRQIISNLLGNAFKFTNKGEVGIHISIAAREGDILTMMVKIWDTGVGIAPQAMNNLFQAFQQADNSTTRKFGGTGLGLAISKKLIELLGGKIGVSSTPGKGSAFWFTFRAKSTSSSLSKPQLGDSIKTAVKILIVDDNDTNRLILEKQLKSFGASCVAARDAYDALYIARQHQQEGKHFDLVITDYMMPGMNGCGFTEKLAELTSPIKPKVILLSSAFSHDSKNIAHCIGVDLVMNKPVRKRLLSNAIYQLLRGENVGAWKTPDISANANPIHSRSLKILAAEDNEINQKVIAILLRKLNQKATIVANGQEAVTEALSSKYDILLMDCQMPVMDGYDATREIRRRGSDIHIIAMTANSMEGDAEKCLACGMNQYLVKPIKVEMLEKALSKAVQLD